MPLPDDRDRYEDDEPDDRPRPRRRRPDDEDDEYDDRRGGRKPATGLALTAMICGIASIPLACLCGAFSAPASLCGIIFGFIGMKQSKGMALTGVICGFVSILLAVASVIIGLGMQANMQNGQNPFAR